MVRRQPVPPQRAVRREVAAEVATQYTALRACEAQVAQSGLDARSRAETARLTANGVASLAPVAPNTSDEGRAKNRRVELVPF